MPRFAANLSFMFTEVPFLDRFEGALCAGVGDPLAVFDPQSEAVAACTGTTTAVWYSRVREQVCAPGTTREVTMLSAGSGSAVWARERHRYTLGLARTDGRWGFDRDITPEACAVAQREGYFVLNHATAFVPATLYVGERAYPVEAGAFGNTFLWGAGSSDPLRLEVPQVREIPLEFDRIDESGRAHVQERALAPSTASRFTLDAGSLTSFRVGRSAPEGIHMTDLSFVSRGARSPAMRESASSRAASRRVSRPSRAPAPDFRWDTSGASTHDATELAGRACMRPKTPPRSRSRSSYECSAALGPAPSRRWSPCDASPTGTSAPQPHSSSRQPRSLDASDARA